ncbi:hypothetical protein Hanom_Chr17g01575641 [Helianthus anomalus]
MEWDSSDFDLSRVDEGFLLNDGGGCRRRWRWWRRRWLRWWLGEGEGWRRSRRLSFEIREEEDVRRVGRCWKRWEDIGPCLRGEEDVQSFEHIFLMKCLLKNKWSA